MEKQFFILLGRSGSGKGTQAELLKGFLESNYTAPVTHITTGGGFREFIARDTYVSKLSQKINENGGLQPEFLAVWNWSNIFIDSLQGSETVILDGAPRKAFEVSVLDGAIGFLGYKSPVVLYLDVTESGSRERLAVRGRSDDLEDSQVNNRMEWFETDVLPALDMYRHNPRYTVLHINGGQSIEDVHNEIVEKLSLLK